MSSMGKRDFWLGEGRKEYKNEIHEILDMHTCRTLFVLVHSKSHFLHTWCVGVQFHLFKGMGT